MVVLSRLMTSLETVQIEVDGESEIEAWTAARVVIDKDGTGDLDWCFMEADGIEEPHVCYVAPKEAGPESNGKFTAPASRTPTTQSW
jgi:hypothetical protein